MRGCRRKCKGLGGSIPSSVGIKTFSGRWGSCNTEGNMEFNWKVIIAPNRIIDYVVVHELCHLHHYNHRSEVLEVHGTGLSRLCGVQWS